MLLERIIRTLGANADDKLDIDLEGRMNLWIDDFI